MMLESETVNILQWVLKLPMGLDQNSLGYDRLNNRLTTQLSTYMSHFSSNEVMFPQHGLQSLGVFHNRTMNDTRGARSAGGGRGKDKTKVTNPNNQAVSL